MLLDVLETYEFNKDYYRLPYNQHVFAGGPSAKSPSKEYIQIPSRVVCLVRDV